MYLFSYIYMFIYMYIPPLGDCEKGLSRTWFNIYQTHAWVCRI